MPTAEQQLAEVRKVLPAQFQNRFDKLWKRQRRELLRIVGSPPDPSKVSKSQWKKWADEQAAAFLMLMLGYTLSQTRMAIEELDALEMTQSSSERLRRAIERNIVANTRQRARFAADSISNTSQNRLRGGMHPDEVMSDSRSRMITTTEMTAARSAAVAGMYNGLQRFGIECELVWRVRPCQHCEVCPLLEGTTYDYWSRFVPSGPPVHPHCCCVLELLFGERASLLRRRRIRTGPPAAMVNRAIARSGFRIR